jgi:hypothetical protein
VGVNEAAEPCVSCGEETAVGSPLFSGRRRIEKLPASAVFLCEVCDAQIAATRSGKPLTDDQVRRFVDGGSMAMITWTDGGMGGIG